MKRALAIGVTVALTISASASASAAGTESSTQRSSALVRAPATDPFVASVSIPAETARVVADGLARDIPLPAGGSFDGVRWETAGGVFSRPEIVAVLQYNASCQWLRAWRDGRDAEASRQVIADVPSWPAWRFAETAAVLGQVAADVRAGGGETASAVLADCDASHEREAAYATARGLKPGL